MSDAMRPGEVDLESHTPDATPAPTPIAEPEPAAEPVVEPVAAAADPEPEPVVEPEPDKKRGGMLEELITERTLRKQAEGKLKELSPILSRINPDLAEAIQEGRISVQPKATQADARKEQLADTARELRLYSHDTDGNLLRDAQGQPVLDVEAAERVDRVIRKQVAEASRPANEKVEQLEHQTRTQVADRNIAEAVRFATEHGIDPEVVRDEFEQFKSSPNGAGLLTQPEICKQVWEKAVGRAFLAGKAAPKTPKKDEPPAVIPAEATGKRTPSTPAMDVKMQQVYRQNGIDPAKSFTATRQVNLNAPIELE